MTDSWTSKATHTVTVHFVNNALELHSAVIKTALLPSPPPPGVRIAEMVSDVTKRVGMKLVQVIAVVHNEEGTAACWMTSATTS